jgi:hypothetical protein
MTTLKTVCATHLRYMCIESGHVITWPYNNEKMGPSISITLHEQDMASHPIPVHGTIYHQSYNAKLTPCSHHFHHKHPCRPTSDLHKTRYPLATTVHITSSKHQGRECHAVMSSLQDYKIVVYCNYNTQTSKHRGLGDAGTPAERSSPSSRRGWGSCIVFQPPRLATGGQPHTQCIVTSGCCSCRQAPHSMPRTQTPAPSPQPLVRLCAHAAHTIHHVR